MRVRRQISLICELLMTLRTGAVSAHTGVQLIISPLFSRAQIIGCLVHPVTGETRHLSVDETGRPREPVVLTAGDTDHSIIPELPISF
jgi:hypothetical protein